MKKCIFLALSSIYFTCQGQYKDTALLKVKYKFIHVFDTTKPESPGIETMQLYVGKKASEFNSYEFETEYNRYHKARWETIGPDGTIHHGSNYPANHIRKSNLMQYHFTDEGKSYGGYNFVYELYFVYPFDLPQIKWDIKEDTKLIQNIQCQKANAIVKGRSYEVWFAPALPFSSGPWKLNGLPGLILEASDIKQQVKFQFISLENVKTENHVIQLPPNAIKTTREKFNALMESVKMNPFILAKFNGVSDETADRFLKDNEELISKIKLNNANKIGPVLNNPIELSDK